jgi:hypothetical protein
MSNESSFYASIIKDFSSILNKLKCTPPPPNTPSAIIDLSAPMPPPGTASSLTTEEVPELLVNKVFPAYMRCAKCFQCQRTGHYKSFALTIIASLVNDHPHNIIQTTVHFILQMTLLLTTARMMMKMTKKMTMFLINMMMI